MTNNEDIPPEVRQFILAKIDSVPHLEALLLVWRHSDKLWTEDELAKSLFVQPSTAKNIARDLTRQGWIKSRPEKADAFGYDHSWDPEGKFMATLDVTYRTRLVRVATLIHSNVSVAIRDFAKAFDFKKKE